MQYTFSGCLLLHLLQSDAEPRKAYLQMRPYNDTSIQPLIISILLLGRFLASIFSTLSCFPLFSLIPHTTLLSETLSTSLFTDIPFQPIVQCYLNYGLGPVPSHGGLLPGRGLTPKFVFCTIHEHGTPFILTLS